MTTISGFGMIRGAPPGQAVANFRVVAPLVMVKDSEGVVHHAYRGCLLEWLSPEQEAMFLEDGLVERIGKR